MSDSPSSPLARARAEHEAMVRAIVAQTADVLFERVLEAVQAALQAGAPPPAERGLKGTVGDPRPSPQHEPAESPFYTAATLSARWHVSRQTVYDAVKKGALRATVFGANRIRISAEEVLRYEREGAYAQKETADQ